MYLELLQNTLKLREQEQSLDKILLYFRNISLTS